MRLLAIGDIIGKPGRATLAQVLPGLRRDLALDLVIANAENTAGGRGLTTATAEELFQSGVDVLTSGNHIWDQREIIPTLDQNPRILRPVNYPHGVAGKGYCLAGDVLVVNAIGRTFLGEYDNPFNGVDQVLEEFGSRARAILVDFHAETTSEKAAMAWHLDGRVSAVVGTHTHVPTADTKIFPRGTAFVSDLGMVGAAHSVIGFVADPIVERFRTQLPARFTVEEAGPMQFNAVLVETDDATGRAVSIERVDRVLSHVPASGGRP